MFTLLCSGCLPSDRGASATEVADHYFQLFFESFSTEKVSAIDRKSLSFPKRKSISSDIENTEGQKVGLMAFVRLYKCELSRLLAEQSNSMQKLRDSEEKFFYSVEFIYLGRACVALRENLQDKLTLQLQEAVTEKTDRLAHIFADALFATPEFSNFFSAHGKPVYFKKLMGSRTRVESALTTFLAKRQMAVSFDGAAKPDLGELRADVYGALDGIRHDKLAGRLLYSALYLQRRLALANRELERFLSAPSLICQLDTDSMLAHPFHAEARLLVDWLRLVQHLEPIANALSPSLERHRGYWRSHWAAGSDSTVYRFLRSYQMHEALLAKFQEIRC